MSGGVSVEKTFHYDGKRMREKGSSPNPYWRSPTFFRQTSNRARGPTDTGSNTQIVPDGGGHPDQSGNQASSGQVGSPTSSILLANIQGLYSGSRKDKVGRLKEMMVKGDE